MSKFFVKVLSQYLHLMTWPATDVPGAAVVTEDTVSAEAVMKDEPAFVLFWRTEAVNSLVDSVKTKIKTTADACIGSQQMDWLRKQTTE
jgi:hypothetical protein